MKKVITPATSRTIGDAVKETIKQQERRVITPVTRESFSTDEEYNYFMEFTKPLPVKKLPKMPCKTNGEYLKEYNLIMSNQSTLTGTQRMVVKNIIHDLVRKGYIELTTTI